MEQRPLMLGIVGDSASGKTTLMRGVVRILGSDGVTPVCLDDYHRYERSERAARGLTALDPAANDLALMADHLTVLRAGGTIVKPSYDHRTGTFREPETVTATRLVIAHGLLTLTPPDLCDLFDLTVYLDPDDDLRAHWKVQRDLIHRGYTPAEYAAQQAEREADARSYVQPQRRLVDLVVSFFAPERAVPEAVAVAELSARLFLRRRAGQFRIGELLAHDAQTAPQRLVLVRDAADPDGLAADMLQIDGRINQPEAQPLAELLWSRLVPGEALPPGQLGRLTVGHDRIYSPALALVQLLVAGLLVRLRSG